MQEHERTTFLMEQELMRKDCTDFFRTLDHLQRLRKFTLNNDHGKIFAVVFFFVKRFEKGRLVHNGTGLYCIAEEYSHALATFKKRFYDFESKEGKGDLYWKGEQNPTVQLGHDVFLTLPVLVAMKWFISMRFDAMFWMRYEDIMAAYVDHTAKIKERYTTQHRQKMNKLVQEARQQVLEKREEEELNDKKRKTKKVHMSRSERREVAQIIADARKNKKIKSKKKPAAGRKPKIQNQFAIITQIEGENIITQ